MGSIRGASPLYYQPLLNLCIEVFVLYPFLLFKTSFYYFFIQFTTTNNFTPISIQVSPPITSINTHLL
jgi:hypothetical protein